jgi:outer membrane biosynthesis protein TonB
MSYQQFGHVDRDERIDYGGEPPPGEELPPRRGLPGILLAVGVMAIFAGGLWFAYHQGAKHAGYSAAEPDKIPLLRADTEPVKVKPDKAGGMDIPDKDNPIYALRPGGNRVEKLLPPPEAPAPRPIAPPPPPLMPQVQAPLPPVPLPAPGPAPAHGPAPKVQPAPLLSPAQVAALAKPATPAPGPTGAQAAGGAGMKIQLASLRNPDQAREEWARLKRDNPDLLGKLTAVAVRSDQGERGIYYRVEAGPIGDKAAAQRLCKALKERDLECSLVQ